LAAVVIPIGFAAQRLRRHLRRRRLMSQPPPERWIDLLTNSVALYRILPADLRLQLHGHLQNILAEKHFEGCGGLALTEEMRVTVAALAALLLLNRKSSYFPKCDSILIYPSAYVAEQERNQGGVHVREASVRLGESWVRGVVVLAWESIQQDAAALGRGNVVLHEFAHQLDQEDGAGDGAPILAHRSDYAAWHRIFSEEYDHLQHGVRHHQRDVIDPYGATNPAEFFAVATETFFTKAEAMQRHHPALYEALRNYYRLDPALWSGATGRS
jgi:Mlc titration factor MtfA (ptsG expression regulator)